MNYSSDKVSITTGCVKWFDPAKGFGFIVSEIGGPDILLHANVLRAFGQTSIAEGARVRVEVQTTPRGVQAVSIQEIEPPAPDRNVSATILSEIEELEREARLEPARVKWYDRAKGFGFANVFASPSDVFLHAEVLRRAGLTDLQAGEAVSIRVADGRRGKLAVEVGPWEAGLSEKSRED